MIIPASRPPSLRRCLESLARAAQEPLECLVVLNHADCGAAAHEFRDRLALRLLAGGREPPGASRNRALAAARGTWLCFLDDDVEVPPDYFAALSDAVRRHPEASVIGGPNLTPPWSAGPERLVGHLLGSWLGAGPMRRRVAGYAAETWCDDRGLILCNMSIRRDALASESLRFDADLPRNEENLLLARLSAAGHRALHCPGVAVYHERRGGLASFSRQCFLSGLGRGAMTLKRPSSLRFYHLAPLAAALGLLGAPLRPRLAALGAALYAAAALVNSLHLALRNRESPAAVLRLWLLHPAAHLSYAAGMARGLAAGPPGAAARAARVPP